MHFCGRDRLPASLEPVAGGERPGRFSPRSSLQHYLTGVEGYRRNRIAMINARRPSVAGSGYLEGIRLNGRAYSALKKRSPLVNPACDLLVTTLTALAFYVRG